MSSSQIASSSMDEAFVAPIRSFDAHCYFHAVSRSSRGFVMLTTDRGQEDEKEVRFAENLRLSIQQSFPDLALYRMHHIPIGPHPIGMFEVDVASPVQFGALIPFLAINHGPLSILVHPNTGNPRADHTVNAIWIGQRLSLSLKIFDKLEEMNKTAAKLGRLGEIPEFREHTA